MYTSSDSGVELSEGVRLRMLWQTTPRGLRCGWVHGETPAGPTYPNFSHRRAPVNAHERNRRWRLALVGRVAA